MEAIGVTVTAHRDIREFVNALTKGGYFQPYSRRIRWSGSATPAGAAILEEIHHSR